MKWSPALALLPALFIACSSSTQAEGDAGVDPQETAPSFCVSDPRAQTFVAGLTQRGKAAALKVTLLTIAPSPSAKGDNDWTFVLTDMTGAPVDGATIAVKPFMPDHGHGSAITPQIAAMGAGKYSLHFNLFMPGLWQLTFTVQAADKSDSVIFSFCIAQ